VLLLAVLSTNSRSSDHKICMMIRVFDKLPNGLDKKLLKFHLENFYEDDSYLHEYIHDIEEKYFSTPSAWVVAYEDGAVVGTVFLHKRTLQFKGKKVLLGGIGGVCTHKRMRKRGTATKMLTKGMKVLSDWKCDIAFLCTDLRRYSKYYAKFGFAALNKPYNFYGRSGKFYEEMDGMIAPVTSPEKCKNILGSKNKLYLGHGAW